MPTFHSWRGTGSRRQRQQPVRYRPRHFLLTKNEAAFFRVLNALVADRYQISCKVRLADIVTCDDADWKRGHANRISQKHIDFVLNCPESSRIVAAIELDDSSHECPERRARDAFLNRLFWQVGVILIRVPAKWDYDFDVVGGQLAKAGLFLGRRQGSRVSGRRRYRNEKSCRWSFGVAQSPRAHTAGRR